MSGTRRLREAVRVYLETQGSANTVEIFDHLNNRFRWGATMNKSVIFLPKISDLIKLDTLEGNSE